MSAKENRREFLDPDAVSRLLRLSLQARQAMQGHVSGRHASPHRGASVEFAEYRKYVPGDDPRRLDWRAFGRSDRYYIKEFEADTNLRLYLLLDTSGSMRFKSSHIGKFDYAKRLAATLATLAIRQGDAVGLVCAADGVIRNVPPRRQPAHLSLIYDALQSVRPRGESALPAVMHQLAETERQRAFCVILSDLFMPPEELQSAFQHLRFSRHDVAVLHLLDREEIEFPFEGPLRFEDLEGGRPILAETSRIAEDYRAAVRAHLETIQTLATACQIDYHRAMLEQDYETVLANFLLRRHPQGA